MDRELAGLRAAPLAASPETVVHLGEPAPWGARPEARGGLVYRAPTDEQDPAVVEVVWLEGRPGLRMRYIDGTEFHVREDAGEVWATWVPPMTIEDAATYLLGPVLGYVLRRRGVLSLHASGVVIDGRAAAFCGGSGAGKSTIAAACAAAGHASLSDDVLALRRSGDVVLAYPAYDHLRVWGDSARMLMGETHELPWLTPNWEKRAFPVEALGYAVAREPAPLGWIFVVDERVDDDGAPRIEPMGAADAFMALTANTSANYLLDRRMRAAEFTALTGVLAKTPAYRLVPHADPAFLGALVEVIVKATRER